MDKPLPEQNISDHARQKDWRERFIRAMLIGASGLGLFAIIPVVLIAPTPMLRGVFIGVYLTVLAATLIRLPYMVRAGVIAILPFILGAAALTETGIRGHALAHLLAFSALSALLFGPRLGIIAIAIGEIAISLMGTLLLNDYLMLTGESSYKGVVGDWIIGGALFLILSWAVNLGLQMLQEGFKETRLDLVSTLSKLQDYQQNLEERVETRTAALEKKTSQLNAVNYISRQIADAQDIQALLNQAVNLVSDQFDAYHTGIFLINEQGNYITLQAASSDGGKRLIDRGYRLRVGMQGIAGRAADGKTAHIGLDTGGNAVVFDTPELPETRSEIALPLIARNHLIGLLDIQSAQSQAFSRDDIEVFQTLADQIAAVMDNIRLLSETRALVNQLEKFSAYQSQEAWQKFTRHRAPAFQFTPLGTRPIFPSPPSDREGAERFTIPLLLRGQKIGDITLRRKESAQKWTQRERDLTEKIAEQVALALENSRLVEDAQRNAKRDQLIAAVSSRVRETLDVDTVIKTAALELQKIFDLKEAEVSIGSLVSDNAPRKQG